MATSAHCITALYAASKRVSSLIDSTAESARLRSTAANSRITSAPVGTCSLTLPMRSKFCKVTITSYQPDAWTRGHATRKAIDLAQLARKLARRHHRWIDFAPKPRVNIGERAG